MSCAALLAVLILMGCSCFDYRRIPVLYEGMPLNDVLELFGNPYDVSASSYGYAHWTYRTRHWNYLTGWYYYGDPSLTIMFKNNQVASWTTSGIHYHQMTAPR